MIDELKVILEEMKIHANDDDDPEVSHHNGDNLLVKTLELISSKTDIELQNIITEIIDNYNKVQKWYA